MKKFSLAFLLRSAASCPSPEGGEQLCILLPSGPPFMLDVFLAVGQTSSLLPRAGRQPLLPAAAALSSWSRLLSLVWVTCGQSRLCCGRGLCGAGGVRSSPWYPRGCPGCPCAAGRTRAVLGCPCPAPWGTGVCAAPQQSRPAAGFDRLVSNVLQLVPRAQPPACFWEPLAELRAIRRGQGDPACSCLRTLRPSAPSPRCSVLVFGCGAMPRVPLSHDPWVGSRAWQPREQIGGAGPAWARPSVPTGTEASP